MGRALICLEEDRWLGRLVAIALRKVDVLPNDLLLTLSLPTLIKEGLKVFLLSSINSQ